MPSFFPFVLICFFLSFAYLAHKDLRRGIYVAIFLMPAYLVRFVLFGVPTTALEIMIYILFFLYLCRPGKMIRLRDIRCADKDSNTLLLGIVLLLTGVLVSTIFSLDLRTSLGAAKGWMIDPFLFFVVYVGVIKDREDVTRSVQAYAFSAFAVALAAAVYALAGQFTFDGRLRAFYESPNYLAMYLAPAFLFLLCPAVCDMGMPRRGKLVRSLMASLIFLIILLTRSYGAILGIAAAVVVGFAKRCASRKLNPGRSKALLAAGMIALVLFSCLSHQKYEQLMHAGERSSLASRFMIWNAAAKMLADSPFLGIGPGTFQERYLAYQDRFAIPYLEWAVPQPHNTFLAFYLQAGLLGLAGFILILLWLSRRSRGDDAILLFLVYFLVHGLIDTLYWKNDLAVIFWLVIGIGYLGTQKQWKREG